MKKYLQLFSVFFKIGAVSFGGGIAMLPMLQRELSDKRGWVTPDELSDYYAIGQCTPGVIAVNTATFVGFKQAGIAGGIIATLGLVFPSMVIICIIAALLANFADLPTVKNAFAGIRVCVVALILNSVIKLWKNAVRGKIALAMYLVVLAAALFTPLPVTLLVVLSGAAGIVIYAVAGRSNT